MAAWGKDDFTLRFLAQNSWFSRGGGCVLEHASWELLPVEQVSLKLKRLARALQS
jgi:hypothetical protein